MREGIKSIPSIDSTVAEAAWCFANERLTRTQIPCNCKTISDLHHRVFTQMITEKGGRLRKHDGSTVRGGAIILLSVEIYLNTEQQQQNIIANSKLGSSFFSTLNGIDLIEKSRHFMDSENRKTINSRAPQKGFFRTSNEIYFLFFTDYRMFFPKLFFLLIVVTHNKAVNSPTVVRGAYCNFWTPSAFT